MRVYLLRVFLVGLGLASVQSATGQTLNVFVESPGAETVDFTGSGIIAGDIETATFDTTNTGTYTGPISTPIGTFNSSALPGTSNAKLGVEAADEYGGAGGTGNYIALGSQPGSATPVAVSLNTSTNFLGLWWSAADTNNSIELFNNGTLVTTITDADMSTVLPDTTGTTITAINRTTKYNTTAFYGNPSGTYAGQDGGEGFYYVEIVLTGGTFNEIEILNNNMTSTGFESDNWSIYNGTVALSNIPGTDVSIIPVPEPSQYAAMSGAILLCLVAGHRLLKRRRRS